MTGKLPDVSASGPLQSDEYYMRLAMEQAHQAELAGEVPVGAVIVDPGGEVIACGQNMVLRSHDPSAHAEVVAMRRAGSRLSNYRLPGLTLYVTLEPCTMCLGALFHARIARLVYGAADPKTGACGGRLDLTGHGLINFHCTVQGGVMAAECGQMLTEFFRRKRLSAKAMKDKQIEI